MSKFKKFIRNPSKYYSVIIKNIRLGRPALFPILTGHVALPITNRTLIKQPIKTPLSSIKAIGVRFKKNLNTDDSKVTIKIFSVDNECLLEKTISGSQIADSKFYIIEINPPQNINTAGYLQLYSLGENHRNFISVYLRKEMNSFFYIFKHHRKEGDIVQFEDRSPDCYQDLSIDLQIDPIKQDQKIRTYLNDGFDKYNNSSGSNKIYILNSDIENFVFPDEMKANFHLTVISLDSPPPLSPASALICSVHHPLEEFEKIKIITNKLQIPLIVYVNSYKRIEEPRRLMLLSSANAFIFSDKNIKNSLCGSSLSVPFAVSDSNFDTAIRNTLNNIYNQCLPKVSFVTIIDVKKDSMAEVMSSYFSQNYAGEIEFIFVNDFEDQDLTEFERLLHAHIIKNHSLNLTYKIINTPSNSGNCYSRNLGIEQSSGDIIFIIDFDCFINSEFITSHVHAHSSNDCEVVIGPCNIESDGQDPSYLLEYLSSRPSKVMELSDLQDKLYPDSFLNCITRNFSIKKNSIKEQLFDLQFSYSLNPSTGFGWEDIEMGYRLYKRGLGIKFTEDAISIHISHKSSITETDMPRRSIINFKKLFLKHPELAFIARRWFNRTLENLNSWSSEKDQYHEKNLDLRYLNSLRSYNSSTLPGSTKTERPLKILTYRWHVPHQYELYKNGHEYHLVKGAGTPFTDHWEYSQRPLPSNAKFVNLDDIRISDYDLAILHFDENVLNYENTNGVIGSDWGANFRYFVEKINLPKVAICHGTPQFYGQYTPGYDKPNLMQVIESSRLNLIDYTRDMLVICNSYQAQVEWGFKKSKVIWHGFDPCEFLPSTYEKGILSPGGPLVSSRPHYRGLYLFNEVFSDAFPAEFMPENLVVPEPDYNYTGNVYAIAKYKSYINSIRKYSVYFNPTLRSPMPRARCEPMMCGVVTVNANNHDVDLFIKNGINGFYSNDVNELRDMLIYLMKNPTITQKIGFEARKTAIDIFNHDRFIGEWNAILREIIR